MHAALQSNQFFVKEQVGLLKASNSYDIFDPATGTKVMECREPNLGMLASLFRFTDFKRMTPFELEVRASDGQKVLTVKRGFSLFLSKVDVLDETGRRVGGFQQRFFSIGGKFDVLYSNDRVACTLQGTWTSWDFRFMDGQVELARVSKEWAGLGKELFTSADNYVLSVNSVLAPDNPVRILVLAAVMCIDMVLKE